MFSDWLEPLRNWGPIGWVLALPWFRVWDAPIGVKIALGALSLIVALGGIAAAGRFVELLFPSNGSHRSNGTNGGNTTNAPRTVGKRSRRKWGPKYVVLFIIALLPGGVVGTAGVLLLMGKGHWRRDAVQIVGLALLPGMFLLWLSSPYFPLPWLSHNFWASGVLGIAFALLHLWALIKLLREAWGEPVEKVPWWPPLAFWLQGLIVAGALMLVLGD